MKDIMIASFDMEVGGVERSLVSMLEHFDYTHYQVDLMLYHHQGDFLPLLSEQANLIEEIPQYTTFRKPIARIWKEKHYPIGLARILAKLSAALHNRQNRVEEPGYLQMQLMWKYALPFLPSLDKEYDVAISYLWPHYFVAEKVIAKRKIAWIHTDYSTIATDPAMDEKMWNTFDYLIAVSEACGAAFLKKYKELEKKLIIMENIVSPELIRKLAKEKIIHPMADDSRFKLVTVARLSHAKGIDQAVRALKKLKDNGYLNIIWYIVGYGGDEAMLRKLIASYGLEEDFILLGKKVNPYPFIKASDIYVQPSRYEGKAVTVKEAQILSKPVLITNYPTAYSQVKDGVDGYICDMSVTGIADGIQRLYEHPDLRKKVAETCKHTNYHNWNELEKLYQIV